MIAPLVRLYARRVVTPASLAIVAGVTLLAIRSGRGEGRILETSTVFAEEIVAAGQAGARSAWIAALVTLIVLAPLVASRAPDRWFRSEGDWLGTSPAPRTSIVLSALAGLALGAALLTALVGGLVGALRPSSAEGTLLEHALVAGPTRSIVLLPGESFEQSLVGAAVPAEGRLRVRVTPTLGGIAPTTAARATSNGATSNVIVARRTWLELDVGPGADRVEVSNVGMGALAIVGPNPVEIWRPSRALLGGHVRVAGHAALFVITLSALAFGLGAWMGPGIAATLAFALWLGALMLVGEGPLGLWLPGGEGLARALRAVGEGRSPLFAPPEAVTASLAVCAVAASLARWSLGSWRREARA